MKFQQARVIVEIDHDVKFSSFNNNGETGGVQTIDSETIDTVKQLLEDTLSDINDLSRTDASVENSSSIEIKLGEDTVFSHIVPMAGTMYGTMTNDVPTNLKIKQILENALNQIELSLKSNS